MKYYVSGSLVPLPPNLKRIKYFNLSFYDNHLLTKTKICAKFERNRWFELYHLLPGSLMDTLLKLKIPRGMYD